MARGWESKSIENQMEEELHLQGEIGPGVLSPEEVELKQKIESLQLARSHVMGQLDKARQEAHQRMLKQSLRAIDREIESLSGN
jgi:hypothetical protein